MKKSFIFAILALILSVTVFSQIIVYQDDKQTNYTQGSEVVISGKKAARVLYEGVRIIVPSGQRRKVFIKKEKNTNMIVISGTYLKSIEAVGKSFSSYGPAKVYISLDTMKIVKAEGDAFVDPNGFVSNRVNKNNQADKTKNKSNKKQDAFAEDLEAVSNFSDGSNSPEDNN